MKTSFWLPALLFMVPVCALAQVRVNSSALQQLQGLPVVQPTPAPSPPVPVVAKPHAHSLHKARPPAAPSPVKPKAAPAATQVKPVSKPAPKPAPAMVAPAALVVQIEFAPQSAVVSPEALKALQPFCHASATTLPLITRAPGAQNNMANTMQLAMQRALALRTALIACGVPAHIIVPYAVGTVAGADNNQALIGVSPPP